jgi:nucleotide-binding universal stress UspA family protein
LKALCSRAWPPDSEVKIVSVPHFPLVYDPFLVGYGCYLEALDEERERTTERVASAAQQVREQAPGLRVSTEVLEGSPKKAIVEEAERWEADLVMVGSHGHDPVSRFLLGSVSHAVALHAPCSVEIVRAAIKKLPAP